MSTSIHYWWNFLYLGQCMKTLQRLYSGYCCYRLQRAHCCSLSTAQHYPPLALILKQLPAAVAAVSEAVCLPIAHGIQEDPMALQALSEVCLASCHKGFSSRVCWPVWRATASGLVVLLSLWVESPQANPGQPSTTAICTSQLKTSLCEHSAKLSLQSNYGKWKDTAHLMGAH